jgi:hypothetical protein
LELQNPFRIFSENCNDVFEFEVDEDIEISGDVVYEEVNGVERPILDGRESESKWYRTGMCSFEGLAKFVEYEKNDNNANKALKRLIAKNDHHDDRKEYEACLAGTLAKEARRKQFPYAQKIAITAAVPEWVPAIPDEEFAPISAASNTMIQLIMERFNRGWVDFVLEVVPEMKDWVCLEGYLLFMEHIEPLYSRWANGNIPHVKRKLRRLYVRFSGLGDTDIIMVQKLEAKVKRELAKPRKAPRLYVGYEAGAMYANELPEFVKVALQPPICISENGHFFTIYCVTKPRIKELDDIFDTIAKGLDINNHIICIYSDDSVWAGNNGGKLYAHNCDISSCDSSVKSSGFFLSGLAMSGFDHERAIGLILQCKLPIRLRSIGDPSKCIKIQRVVDGVVTPIEGSGTVMTTLNNFMIMLMCSIMYIHGGVYGTVDSISEAGIRTGLNLDISADYSSTPEKLQFLKYSPLMCQDGKYHMVRNLGPIFRSFGKVDGDLSPSQLAMTPEQFALTPWTLRMNLFLSSVVKGYVHEPSCRIMDAFRARFTEPTALVVESSCIVELQSRDLLIVDEDSLAARYDLSLQELQDLASSIESIQLGDIVVSETLGRIYNVDYSL